LSWNLEVLIFLCILFPNLLGPLHFFLVCVKFFFKFFSLAVFNFFLSFLTVLYYAVPQWHKQTRKQYLVGKTRFVSILVSCLLNFSSLNITGLIYIYILEYVFGRLGWQIIWMRVGGGPLAYPTQAVHQLQQSQTNTTELSAN
jgi:hypothetical protein